MAPNPPAARLEPESVGADPIAAFGEWLEAARSAGEPLAEAMALATASPERGPSVRMVLLRGADDGGFRFFTNYSSAKAADLEKINRAALCFHWHAPRHRQVRVEGTVERLNVVDSDAYFQSRGLRSQISAWASPQSAVVAESGLLESMWESAASNRLSHMSRPPFWGGYRLIPTRVEFWQEQPDRLHDRINFCREGDRWLRERLAP